MLQSLKNIQESGLRGSTYYYAPTFLRYFEILEERYGTKNALSFKYPDRWESLSYQDLELNVVLRAAQLQRLGFKRGTKIAILGEPSPQWALLAYATVLSGNVLVPLDNKLGLQELSQCVQHSEAQAILIGPQFEHMGEGLLRLCPKLQEAINFDQFSTFASTVENKLLAKASKLALPQMDLEDTALICYTSGTLGNPKGVVVAQKTILFEAGAMGELPLCGPGDVMLSMLPLNHLFAFNGILFCMGRGAEVVMAHSLKSGDLLECLQEKHITVMVTVPLFLDTLKSSIEAKVKSQSPAKQRLFQTLLSYSKILPANILRRKLFASLLKNIGPALKYFVCGGSPLNRESEEFFSLLGIPAYAGYGLTETGPVLAVNTSVAHRMGSVGQPIPGLEIHIEKEHSNDSFGEIWTRGPQVFTEYYKDSELSAEHLTTDGWFKTGDFGFLDDKGYLFITGRKKNLIVLNNGKKVHAEEIETLILSASTLIQDLCVFSHQVPGQGEKVALLLTPKAKLFQGLKDKHEVAASIKSEVQIVCENLAAYKRPTLVEVYFGELPKTNLQKIKRGEAQKIFQSLVEASATPLSVVPALDALE